MKINQEIIENLLSHTAVYLKKEVFFNLETRAGLKDATNLETSLASFNLREQEHF